ncbi:MAG: Clp protease N-terminal domain-containing protein [Solirubrobacteraceae bacterium]
MQQTGEKYTDARRALLASGGGSGNADQDSGVAVGWPEDALGWFTDQAYNAVLLAEDEARMLSHATVDPEHLLLAAARHGNAQWLLLSRARIAGADIHGAILRHRGFGEKLVLHPRPSLDTQEVLRLAVSTAAARGVSGPSTEHLLLALGEHEASARILEELGLRDVRPLVNAKYPVTRTPVDRAFVQRRASLLANARRKPPSPGPIPPIFERFTSQARDAINAGIEHARKVAGFHVEPVDLLRGALDAKTGVAGTVRSHYGWDMPPAQPVQPRSPNATDIFSADARRIVAEDMLTVAERLGHRPLTTGHLLIAILENPDEDTAKLLNSLPAAHELVQAVIDAIPGDEHDNSPDRQSSRPRAR